MGKKGSWFSAIKKVFSPHSKEKAANGLEKKSAKEKKKGKQKNGDTNSFIPLFREPSSIEKIFGDFEREQHVISFRPPVPDEQPQSPPSVLPRVASPRAPSPRAASPRVPSPRAPSPRAPSPRAPSPRIVHHHKEISYRPEPTLRNHHASATKIQASYRGYMARRSFRALKGLVRLQGVVRGQNVKRQTANAMKYMQLLVRVQSQIQSRRIQMLESQARRQVQYKNDKDVENTFGKWTLSQASEMGNNDDWDDSLLTKEEIEARMQKKVEAVVKRERAMAYAYSHQLWKATPKSGQTPLADIRSGGFPWWWNWLERQLPPKDPPVETNAMKTFQPTPSRPRPELKQSPLPQSRQHPFAYDSNLDTPKSSKSTMNLTTLKQARTPPTFNMSTPQANSSGLSKYTRPTAGGSDSPFGFPLKDDDSLVSCPPFSVPSYMAPTASAKAKARASSNPRERFMGTPISESKRRLSFPLTQGIGSFKWKKGPFFSNNKDSGSQRILDKNQSLQSIENMSIDSTVSMPAGVGRRPFNRFV
ncbi:putative IQ motif, EF-hand binding protein [Rosa chinensis]|uniref:Putative IQ motif, EF-hand binding protein n=1 Tax=Rosa chinensis TaxID=74649 RepID=A0A2P6QU71_ROSCH|nr:protein IQ-DOMAIN 14 [Rosa chinensis]PRQ37735.1 putative IQ motif, EF-hand binding protein [Rosa chinensis]